MEERLSRFAKAPREWLAPRGFARVYLGFGSIPAFSRFFLGNCAVAGMALGLEIEEQG